MKKIAVAILIVMACVGLLLFASRIGNKRVATQGSNAQTSENRNESQKQPAEKIEVIHFHATQQCWSCTTVGEYALKTIKEKFPEEYASGKLVFKSINGELSENRDIVIKYQARGSSLFINTIRSGQDSIEEDVTVWRLVSNENQFISYFQNKLNKLLGK
jgi:hypothetical protein